MMIELEGEFTNDNNKDEVESCLTKVCCDTFILTRESLLFTMSNLKYSYNKNKN